MSAHWTNPDYKLHVDQLRGQAKIFSLLWNRMVKENRYTEAKQLHNELVYLMELIAVKEGANCA